MTNKNNQFDDLFDFSLDLTMNELPPADDKQIFIEQPNTQEQQDIVSFNFDLDISNENTNSANKEEAEEDTSLNIEETINNNHLDTTTEEVQSFITDSNNVDVENQSLDALMNLVGVKQPTRDDLQSSTLDAINAKKEIRNEIAEQSMNIMNAGRKSQQSSTKRKKVVEQKNSYFILEHDPTYASDEDSDYDLYYEDVLPIDHNEIKNQSTNKNTLKKILIASAIIILIIILIISISNSLTQPEF